MCREKQCVCRVWHYSWLQAVARGLGTYVLEIRGGTTVLKLCSRRIFESVNMLMIQYKGEDMLVTKAATAVLILYVHTHI